MAVLYSDSIPSFSGQGSGDGEMQIARTMDASVIYGPLQFLSALVGLVLFLAGVWHAPREGRNVAGWLLLTSAIGIWLNFFVPVEVVPTIR